MDYTNDFLRDGVVKLGNILDVDKCKNTMKQFYKLKPFNEQFFKENVFIKENEFDESKSHVGSGPRPGRNLTEEIDLEYIEKNPIVQKTLSTILGSDYNIMQKIFVMAPPTNWIPDWWKKKYVDYGHLNICGYVNDEFRDMTYFYGVDYHQDIADYRDRVGDFITFYVYLDDVTSDMSPLHILPKSHIFGVTTQPHDLKAIDNNKILYNDRIGNSSEFDYYSITGSGGSVNFWSVYLLHGTTRSPATNSPRISLRYLIERGKSTEELPIDKFLKTITGPLIQRKSNKDSSYSDGKIQVGKQKGTGLLAGQVNPNL